MVQGWFMNTMNHCNWLLSNSYWTVSTQAWTLATIYSLHQYYPTADHCWYLPLIHRLYNQLQYAAGYQRNTFHLLQCFFYEIRYFFMLYKYIVCAQLLKVWMCSNFSVLVLVTVDTLLLIEPICWNVSERRPVFLFKWWGPDRRVYWYHVLCP